GAGASAAEPGGDREVLLDRDAPAVRDVETCKRALDDRVGAEAAHGRLRRGLDRDAVGDVDALVDSQQLVLSVPAEWADDQREIDLGRGRTDQRSASASATNSEGSSASARRAGPRPIASSPWTAASRE